MKMFLKKYFHHMNQDGPLQSQTNCELFVSMNWRENTLVTFSQDLYFSLETQNIAYYFINVYKCGDI